MTNYLGMHIIAEFYECSVRRISDNEFILQSISQALEIAQVNIVGKKIHRFKPQGLTGVYLLSQSHFSFHSWPEYRYMAVDMFTCGEAVYPDKAVKYLRKALRSKRYDIKVLKRGKI